MTKSQALLELNKDRVKNSFLISTIEKLDSPEIHCIDGSYAVYEPNDSTYLFSPACEGALTKLVKELQHDFSSFYVNTPQYRDEVMQLFCGAEIQPYLQYYIESSDFVFDESEINENVQIVPLDKSWTEYILSMYSQSEFSRKEYIDKCIDTLPCFGALCGGKRVGFILVHTNGELGPIVVDESMRGKGIARTLNQYMFREYTKLASIGCLFVLVDNMKSQRLCSASGIMLAGEIMWVNI